MKLIGKCMFWKVKRKNGHFCPIFFLISAENSYAGGSFPPEYPPLPYPKIIMQKDYRPWPSRFDQKYWFFIIILTSLGEDSLKTFQDGVL